MPYQPAPPPRRGAPPPVVVGSGVIRVGDPAAFLIAEDVSDYTQGYETAVAGGGIRSGTWWWRQGWFEGNKGLPKRVLEVGYPAPAAPQFAPVTPGEVANYDAGYVVGQSGSTEPGVAEWWWKYGRQDGKAGRPKFGLVPNTIPPMFPIVLEPAPRATPGDIALKYPVYELLPLLFGKRIPYDLAVNIEKYSQFPVPGNLGALGSIVSWGISFEIIENSPFDDDEGYGIGGPNGRLARYIRRLADAGKIDPNPARYGLPAWVGTYRKRGQVRILSRRELEAIGVLDTLFEIGPPLDL